MSEPYGPGPAPRQQPVYPQPAYQPAAYPPPAPPQPLYPPAPYPPQGYTPQPYPPPAYAPQPFPPMSVSAAEPQAQFYDTEPPPRSRNRRLMLGIAAAVVAVIIIGIGAIYFSSNSTASSAPLLQNAYDACGKVGQMSNAGKQLYLDMSGTDRNSGALTSDEILCVVNHLHPPTSVLQHMEVTQATSGRQTDSFSADGAKFDLSWIYSDNGFDLEIRQR